MKTVSPIVSNLAAVLALCLTSGCAHLMKINVAATQLPPGQKLPHHAALVLNPEFSNYKYEARVMGDKFVYPLGAPLRDYARQVAQASFREIEVVPSAEQAGQTADLILIPRPVKTDNSVGVWAWDKVNFTTVVEWVAKDRATQNTVWLKTITADVSETGGNAFTGSKHQRVLMQKLFDDLSLKTHAAFQGSPELGGSQP